MVVEKGKDHIPIITNAQSREEKLKRVFLIECSKSQCAELGRYPAPVALRNHWGALENSTVFSNSCVGMTDRCLPDDATKLTLKSQAGFRDLGKLMGKSESHRMDAAAAHFGKRARSLDLEPPGCSVLLNLV